MPLLFGRAYSLLVQHKTDPLPLPVAFSEDIPGAPPRAYDIPATSARASVFSGLHIKFKAEKDALGHPNTLDLEVYNIAQSTRSKFQDSGGYVRLLAGYMSDWPNLPVVFQGNWRTVDSIRVGPDWVTRIQCGDGETAYRFATVALSLAAGTPAAQVAQLLAAQVQLADPQHIDISAFLRKAPTIKYPLPAWVWGGCIQGNAFEELQRLVGPNYELSIQGGELRCLAPYESTANVVLLSSATGMIGSPEHGTPNASGLGSTLKVRSLLQPRITPGDLVQLAAKNIVGPYRVQRVVHTGDLAGNDWQTEIECLPYSPVPA